MRKPVRSWMYVAATAAIAIAPVAVSGGSTQAAVRPATTHAVQHPLSYTKSNHINCSQAAALCAEVAGSDKVFGHYVGHDEPSMLFYSHKPGSGYRMSYNVTLPTDPSASNPNNPNKSYQFELSGADWFGMAICDTQSYPEQVTTCPRDSDSNILSPSTSPKHVGQAYMEMQFYPPGWIQWPTWQVAVGASSCNPTEWCAAMNIDSLSLNPVTGMANNSTCLSKVGEEYVNFAFITKNGKSQAPANPVDATTATFTPGPQDLFMNSGDHLKVAFNDTANGEQVIIKDLTTGETGSMTASKQNGFAQVGYDPTGTSCTAIPYDFHAMYNESNPKTRVTWAAGSYNVAMDTEIGHFQFCTGPTKIPPTEFGILPNGSVTSCPSTDTEGRGVNKQAPDGDDFFCFPGSEAPTYHVTGCTYTNTGFDGAPYTPLWPNGNTTMHPTPFQFSSPETGANYNEQYSQAGFETDLPAIESTCDPSTGAGCTLIPQTDGGTPAVFYPFYTITKKGGGGCVWQFGNDIPGEVTDFGQNGEYGTLLQQSYTNVGGSSTDSYQDFRSIINNPCPQA